MVINTRDKEITDQPRLNHFDLKSNSTCIIFTSGSAHDLKTVLYHLKLLVVLLEGSTNG